MNRWYYIMKILDQFQQVYYWLTVNFFSIFNTDCIF